MIDLNELDSYRENNRIEAKTALGGLPHSLWETYSAFANALGGVILLGVREDRDKSLHPVDLPDPEGMVQEFLTLLNDSKHVSVNILSQRDVRIETVEGNRIIAIHVPTATRLQKPVYVEGDLRNTFRRNGEGDYRCSSREVRSMQRDACRISRDMKLQEDLDCSVFSRNTVFRYQERLRITHPEITLQEEELLQRIGAAAAGPDGQVHPTAAGLLLFGNAVEILRVFPQFRLEYDDLIGKIHLDSGESHWAGNVMDFYFRLGRMFNARRNVPSDPNGNFSPDSENVRSAIREAFANCLINADYEGEGGIRVLCESGGITFSNPGSFRIGINDALAGGSSDPRNSVIREIFSLIDLGRKNPTGIPGIYRVWKDCGREEPEIRQSFSPDRVNFTLPFSPDDPETLGSDRMAMSNAMIRFLILDYLTGQAAAPANEIAEALSLDPARTRKTLKAMVRERLVEKTENSFRLKA